MTESGGHPYEILDVFTDTPLQGNALAVFPEAEHIPSRLMQATARELNLSETVFVLPGDPDAGIDARLRIFTPTAELPFAGHPTLGAAFVFGARTGNEVVRFQTGSGIVPLTLTRDEGGLPVSGEMEQPLPAIEPFPDTTRLLAALGVSETKLPVELYDNGPRFVVVALDDVEALNPDLRALSALGPLGVSCVAPTEDPRRFHTRMFGPALGVAEDPATGSAAGPVALHLARHGITEFGETIEIHQGAEIGRPSLLRARVDGAAENVERVVVGGSAVTVAHGHFRLQ